MGETGKALYLECNAGISGDMVVASLLDLGADEKTLRDVLESLPVQGFEIEISRVKKAQLDVCDFHVILDKEHENHDHDMEYLYGKEHCHPREAACLEGKEGHSHGEGHCHFHEDARDLQEEHGHAHESRGLREILDIIGQADMTERAREISRRIFQILAKAEAKAHGVPEREVHFHEVGALDSIVDVVSAAVCLDNLGIEECIVPMLCEGRGTVRCQHGVLPVPVPAVLNIAQAHRLKLSITDIQGELVTPTGAAIAAAVKTSDALPESFTVLKSGMGAGKRTYERPGILRAMLLETASTPEHNYDKDVIYKLETNIDDCSGEMLGYVMDKLFAAGARDVHYAPVYMKKNRPGYQLNVICGEEKIPELEQIIFKETTTIGIRRQRMERSVLSRDIRTVMTSLGEAEVKVCLLPEKRCYPEYDSVVRLCKKTSKSYREVYDLIIAECAAGLPEG